MSANNQRTFRVERGGETTEIHARQVDDLSGIEAHYPGENIVGNIGSSIQSAVSGLLSFIPTPGDVIDSFQNFVFGFGAGFLVVTVVTGL